MVLFSDFTEIRESRIFTRKKQQKTHADSGNHFRSVRYTLKFSCTYWNVFSFRGLHPWPPACFQGKVFSAENHACVSSKNMVTLRCEHMKTIRMVKWPQGTCSPVLIYLAILQVTLSPFCESGSHLCVALNERYFKCVTLEILVFWNPLSLPSTGWWHCCWE